MLRLAAIVFTDIVGYSAMVHRQPELAKRLLDRQRQLIRKLVRVFAGREIETAGDSFLLEFESGYQALECVAEVQRCLARANTELPPDQQVAIRAAIHLGDVEHRGDEVFGDGVNVAARLLPHSPAGGVALSDVVHRQVHNRIGVSARSLGVRSLKNIAQAIEIFTLDGDALATIESAGMRAMPPRPAVHPALYSSQQQLAGAGAAPGSQLWWRFANAQFQDQSLELRVDDVLVALERKPLEVLRHLLWHAGEVVTKDVLLDAVWPARLVSESVLQRAVSRLRDVLGDADEQIIKTARGFGYRLVAPVEVRRSGQACAPQRLELRAGEALPSRPQWKLVRALGSGAFGEAWLAEHERTREQRVYKLALDEQALGSLRREVTIYRLLHDTLGERTDVVRLLDWNLDEAPYFTEAEVAAGGNLVEWSDRCGGLRAIPLHRRLGIAAKIAETLSAAHSVGVLHKDLKPANILVGHEGPVRCAAGADVAPPSPAAIDAVDVRLADFGTGAVVDPGRLDSLGITRMGLTEVAQPATVSGTALYLAPEVIAGQPATLQSDVYALGVILYQLVCGDFGKPLAAGWEHDVDDVLLREDIAAAVQGSPQRRLNDAATLARRLRTLDTRRAARENEQVIAQLREKSARRRAALQRSARFGFALAGLLVLSVAAMVWQVGEARAAAREAQATRAFVLSLATTLPGGDGASALAEEPAMLHRLSAAVRSGGLAGAPAARQALVDELLVRFSRLHDVDAVVALERSSRPHAAVAAAASMVVARRADKDAP